MEKRLASIPTLVIAARAAIQSRAGSVFAMAFKVPPYCESHGVVVTGLQPAPE